MTKVARYIFIIPCYNEEQNIAKVVLDLRKFAQINQLNADILVINDKSTDNTLKVLEEINVQYLDLPFNLGYSGALQAGFKFAVRHNYDFVIQFDGDGQHLPSEALKLIEVQSETNADIVIGSRFLLNTGYKHGVLRSFATGIFSKLIHIMCNERITDPTSGFQLLSKEVFKQYSIKDGFPQFPDANLIIQMIFEGFKIKEVPVQMELRLYGVSMHSGFWNPLIYMIHMFYSIFMILINYGFTKKNKK